MAKVIGVGGVFFFLNFHNFFRFLWFRVSILIKTFFTIFAFNRFALFTFYGLRNLLWFFGFSRCLSLCRSSLVLINIFDSENSIRMSSGTPDADISINAFCGKFLPCLSLLVTSWSTSSSSSSSESSTYFFALVDPTLAGLDFTVTAAGELAKSKKKC